MFQFPGNQCSSLLCFKPFLFETGTGSGCATHRNHVGYPPISEEVFQQEQIVITVILWTIILLLLLCPNSFFCRQWTFQKRWYISQIHWELPESRWPMQMLQDRVHNSACYQLSLGDFAHVVSPPIYQHNPQPSILGRCITVSWHTEAAYIKVREGAESHHCCAPLAVFLLPL